MPNPQSNPYESPALFSQPHAAQFSLSFLFAVCSMVVLLVGLIFIRLVMKPFYDSYGIALPPSTFVACHWLLPSITCLVAALLVVMEHMRFSARLKRNINVVSAIVTIVAGLLIVGAMFVPLEGVVIELN